MNSGIKRNRKVDKTLEKAEHGLRRSMRLGGKKREYSIDEGTFLDVEDREEESKDVKNVVVHESSAGGEQDQEQEQVQVQVQVQSSSESLRLDHWVAGSTDIKQRGALLCRLMARLYRLRGYGDDFRRSIHWYKIGNFLDELEIDLVDEESVQGLIDYHGVGPATVSVLMEIYLTGYLDYIDDLLAVVEELRGNEEFNVTEVSQQVEELGARNAEGRRSRLQEISTITRPSSKVSAIIQTGVRFTGKQRRETKKSTSTVVRSTRSTSEAIRVDSVISGTIEMESCAVCLEELEDDDELIGFECHHCYHEVCITTWLNGRIKNAIQPNCPLCRKPIQLPK